MTRNSLIVLLLTGFCLEARAQNSAVSWSTFDMGFGIPASPTTAVTSALGEAFVGTAQGGGIRIESGFLSDTLFRGFITGVKANHWLPGAFALDQNYPNPFNPVTTIRYELPKASRVALRVYDLLGRLVTTLVDGELPAGVHLAHLNAGDLPSGVYFYRLESASFTTTKKLVVMK